MVAGYEQINNVYIGGNTEIYLPHNNSLCTLPSTSRRKTHSVSGLTACGGDGTLAGFTNDCITFNKDLGNWEKSHDIDYMNHHVSWQTSQGIILLNYEKASLLNSDGGFTVLDDFTFDQKITASCGIPDDRTETLIVVGGQREIKFKVRRFGLSGFLENLPDMSIGRAQHGCGGYYNDDDKLVSFFNLILYIC